jgi:hypothetical protein
MSVFRLSKTPKVSSLQGSFQLSADIFQLLSRGQPTRLRFGAQGQEPVLTALLRESIPSGAPPHTPARSLAGPLHPAPLPRGRAFARRDLRRHRCTVRTDSLRSTVNTGRPRRLPIHEAISLQLSAFSQRLLQKLTIISSQMSLSAGTRLGPNNSRPVASRQSASLESAFWGRLVTGDRGLATTSVTC